MGRPLFGLGHRGYHALSVSRAMAAYVAPSDGPTAFESSLVWSGHDGVWVRDIDVVKSLGDVLESVGSLVTP